MQMLLSAASVAVTSAVIGNAYYQKKQFYPAVVYITKSNASMAVVYIQFFVIVFLFGKLLRKIFLGTLRVAEFESLLERFWYALTETCLAFTVFRDDFNPRFIALFTVLLFLKSFHWMAEERVDFMERSPLLGWLFHIRVVSLLTLLGLLDYQLLMYAYNATLMRIPTVQLVFGFEYAILLTVVVSTAIKYVLHTLEMRSETPWEDKPVFVLYTELVIGFIKVILYVLFVVIMAKIYALPMFVFRPMFFTIRNFKKALSDVIFSRRAIRNMNNLYPEATTEELRLADNLCIICREDMVNHSKKLPCGHIFHTACLRSWFQRQQTCPTCRFNILRTPNPNSRPVLQRQDEVPAGGVGNANAATVAAAAATLSPNAAQGRDILRNDILSAAGTAGVLGGTPTSGVFGNTAPTALPNFQGMPMVPPPFMMPPPFPFIAPYAIPPPPMPPDLTSLTDDELKALEGNERKSVEERIKLLRNIQLMLDAASLLMANYQMVAPRLQTQTAEINNQQQQAETTGAATSESKRPFAPDEPSTSAAAAAAAAATSYSNIADIISKFSSESTTTPTITEQPHVSGSAKKPDDVIIEDLGEEAHITVAETIAASTAASEASALKVTSAVNINDDESDELNELRRRRLKFLEEQKPTKN